MAREYIKGNNGVEITPERQRKIDEILQGVDLSIDQRGSAPLLSAEFWPEHAKPPQPLYVNLSVGDGHSFTLVSNHEIPPDTPGRIRWTRRDGSTGLSPRGAITQTRRGNRREDARYHRFVSRFIAAEAT
ncbi:hypothetical protein [Acidihalobacter prosperus]|uniref:Uncharacterized protein n=1 Tax=Acidihalobacter prosperus TaxID=160660 RepID=A0A1A6C7Y7_9GAMM|nr:hypothetical protein [Acidihalobacter prosperus]OBS10665.1 hypothetical protein Thpro_020381 [Acidihalobacter prosperus]